jgi:hypothetical protein
LNLLKVIASELRSGEKDFYSTLPQIEFFINHKSQERLCGRSPVQVMSPGVCTYSPLSYMFLNPKGDVLSQVTAQRMAEFLDDMVEYIQVLHKDVLQMTQKQRALHQKYVHRIYSTKSRYWSCLFSFFLEDSSSCMRQRRQYRYLLKG